MARRPKGSYVRNTPDWYFNNACSVGTNNPGAPGLHAVCDLFNNAQDGSNFYVYGLMTFNLGTASIRVQQIQGHAPGTGGPGAGNGPAYAVNASGGQPPGLLYIDFIAGATQPITDPYIFSTLSNIDEYILPTGPLMIIPPGYSLRLLNNAVAFGFQCWIYYVTLRDQGG